MLKYLIILLSLNCFAGKLDLGLGYIGLETSHYKGSDQTKQYNLYVPYLNYDGEYIEADNAILNTKFLNTHFVSFKLSLGAAPNVENNNEARAGMPELLYNFGIGPMLIIHLLNFKSFKFNIESNYRQEFETDGEYTAAFGTTQTNYLAMKIYQPTWSFEISHGLTRADKGFHHYYYSVAPEYETPDRPSYQAQSGHSSKVTIITFRKKIGDFLLFPFYRHESLEDSIIKDSPLVKQLDYQFYGLGFFYLFI